MAQRKTKKTEAPSVNIGAEIFASLRDLEKLKGISVEYMVERLKQALTNAYRKDREDHRDIPAENVVVDLSENGLFMYQVKTVVEEWKTPLWSFILMLPATSIPMCRWVTMSPFL